MFTKGKWEIVDENDNHFGIYPEDGGNLNVIATIWSNGDGQTAEANARRIVQCVNSHDELLEALKEFVACQDEESTTAFNMIFDKAVSNACDIIAAAESEV